MNRGSDGPDGPPGSRGPASMRPRFMNRGSSLLALIDSGKFFASMRPRFMNRGSAVGCPNSNVNVNRFNEAPIHESGKYRSRPTFSSYSNSLQ